MGLLDEAIREHLELKRRRGADATEVSRQEQEALGPARGGPEPLEVPQAEGYDEQPADYEPAPEHVAEHPIDGHADHEAEAHDLHPEETYAEPAPATEIAGQETMAFDVESVMAEEEARAHDAEVGPVQPESAEPPTAPAEPPPEPPPAPPAPEPPTAQHEPAPDAEDVLEETPDFLQETPEHDRLWFEQRPPRDFDFDK